MYGAYDYDFNKGWYIEAGVRHDFIIEDTGLTVTGIADVGYIAGIKREFIFANVKQSGFQHYDIGLVVSYALNHLFEIPRRFGEWSFNGYVYYTQGINRNSIHSDTQLWGGVGVGFKY